MNPEQVHLALNHIAFIGLALSLIPLGIGIGFKSRPAILSGLLIAALCGWTTPFVMDSGEDAYERYEDHPADFHLDSEVEYWLHEHEERGHTGSKVMYAAAAAATIALGLHFWRPKWSLPAVWVVIALAAASLAAGIWIADTGGKIRRPDFRTESPPPAHETEEHEH